MLDLRVLVLALAFAGIVNAQLSLRTAKSFAVLAGTNVGSSGVSLVNGNVGVSPGTTVSGFPPGVITNGGIHANDAPAIQAQLDLTSAYNAAVALTPTTVLTGQNLGGMVLTAGVYFFSGSAQLTGVVTLNGQFNPSSVWVFQIGSTLTTAALSGVLLINSASSCNVFWQVGSSASIGASTTFVGNILALTSVTAQLGAGFTGGVFARNGAVTLNADSIQAGLTCPDVGPTCTYNQFKCGYNLAPGQGKASPSLRAISISLPSELGSDS